MKSLKFTDLKVGEVFKWRTLLGGHDVFIKIDAFSVRNCHTGNEYDIASKTFYFQADDPVILE